MGRPLQVIHPGSVGSVALAGAGDHPGRDKAAREGHKRSPGVILLWCRRVHDSLSPSQSLRGNWRAADLVRKSYRNRHNQNFRQNPHGL